MEVHTLHLNSISCGSGDPNIPNAKYRAEVAPDFHIEFGVVHPEVVDETQTELDDWKEDAEKLVEWALEIYNTTKDTNLRDRIGEDIIAHYALVKKYTSILDRPSD